MMHGWACLGSVLGFCALALATVRVQEDLWRRPWSVRAVRGAQVLGTLLLAAVLLLLVRGGGWGLGLVMFSGHTSFAAGLVLCVLVVHDRWRQR